MLDIKELCEKHNIDFALVDRYEETNVPGKVAFIVYMLSGISFMIVDEEIPVVIIDDSKYYKKVGW